MRLAMYNEHYYDIYTGLMLVNCDERDYYEDILLFIDGYGF
jgi:hypothetical protein